MKTHKVNSAERMPGGIIPDYEILRRIVRWWYNYNSDEAISAEDFRKAYGPAFGDHYFARWINLKCDILKMIGYFGNDINNGEVFLSIVMRRVCRYEKRVEEFRGSLSQPKIETLKNQ